MKTNRFVEIRNIVINNIRGDGDSEVQESTFLNLAPKYYLWIYLVFFGSYLITQFVVHNFMLQAIIVFILINIPGQAIMKIRVIQLKEPFLNFFFGIVLSLMSIMGFFFLVTVLLPIIGISRPLNAPIVGILSNALIALSLLICAYSRNIDQAQNKKPSLGVSRLRHWVYGAVIIFFGFHSVIRMNENHGDFESITFTFCLFFLLISLFLNKRIYCDNALTQILMFSLCLAALVAVTFRGDGGLNGVDINLEYLGASDVLSSSRWSPGSSDSPYHAMLSVTVLPAIISLLTKLSLMTIFKLFYIAIAALIPGILTSFLKRYVRPQIAISTVLILVVGSISYLANFPGLARQIIGTAFFIGILIIAFEISWSISRRKRFIAFLTLGLAYSHYSTGYLFIGIVSLAAGAYSVLAIFDSASLLASGSPEKAIKVHKNRIFSLPFVLGLVVIILFWNGVVTHSSGNIQSAIRSLSSGNQQLNLLGAKNKNIVVGYLQANTESKTKFSASDYRYAVLITNYSLHPDLQARTESLTYEIVPSTISPLPKPLGRGFATFVDSAANIEKLGYQTIMVIISIYGIYFFYRARREHLGVEISEDNSNKFINNRSFISRVHGYIVRKGLSDSLYELFGLTFAGILLAVFIRASSLIGTLYNTDRAAFQISIVWILPFALFFEFVSQNRKLKKLSIVILSIFAAGVLFTQVGLGSLYNGSFLSKVSSINAVADVTIISSEENYSAQWVCLKLNRKDILQSDSLAAVNFFKYPCHSQTLSNISPFVLDQSAFIFSNRPNTMSHVFYDKLLFRRFNFPDDYIQQYYSPVYVSDTTRLYH